MSHTETQNEIIRNILNCGSADVNFICRELDNFDVDFKNVWGNLSDIERPNANQVIGEIYYSALSKAEVNINSDAISIFTNCIDSHLNISGVEMYSFADIVDATTNKKTGKLKKAFV